MTTDNAELIEQLQKESFLTRLVCTEIADQVADLLDRAIAALSQTQAARNPWEDAVIDELVTTWTLKVEHETNPRLAVKDAIEANVKIALDPQVSEGAQALYNKGFEAGAHPRTTELEENTRALPDFMDQQPERDAKVVQLEMAATANECSLNTLRKLLDGPPCLPLSHETPESDLLAWTDCIHRALIFLGPAAPEAK